MAKKSNEKTGERIAKVIARAGLASRRAADALIAAGRVTVNGATVSSPALNVTARDRIMIDGQQLPRHSRTRLFLYHKPRGLVTTHADPQGRPTIFRALPKNLPRLISVGRLDLNSEGLLLLTNDGGLARVLELPATGWERRYRVRALGRVTQGALDKIKRGVTLAGVRYGPIDAMLDREQGAKGANLWLTVSLREGKNREVRRVLESLGMKVNRLIRVAYGPFELGELDNGAVEEIETEELRAALGPELAKQAHADFNSSLADEIPHRHSGVYRRLESRIHSTGHRFDRNTMVMDSSPHTQARDRNDRNKKNLRRRSDRSSGPRPSRPSAKT